MPISTMTAAELIKILVTYDPETPVLVDGYENGFDHLYRVEEIEVVDRTEPESWEGQADRPSELRGASAAGELGSGLLNDDVAAGGPYIALVIRGQRGEHREP